MELIGAITRFPDDPLEMTSLRQWGCERKVRYFSRKSARRHRRRNMGTYKCRYCGNYHLTTRRKDIEE